MKPQYSCQSLWGVREEEEALMERKKRGRGWGCGDGRLVAQDSEIQNVQSWSPMPHRSVRGFSRATSLMAEEQWQACNMRLDYWTVSQCCLCLDFEGWWNKNTSLLLSTCFKAAECYFCSTANETETAWERIWVLRTLDSVMSLVNVLLLRRSWHNDKVHVSHTMTRPSSCLTKGNPWAYNGIK